MAKKNKISWFYIIVLVLAGLICGLTIGMILVVGHGLPEIRLLEDAQPQAATRILSSDGRVLAELYVENRKPLPLGDIPLDLRNAIVAVEDKRFYRHAGLDVIRNVGALIRDIQKRRFAQGASTITQQLARNLFLTSEKTLSRKLKEVFLALQIEHRYTKDEILRLYMNKIYLGSGTYGFGAAAERYYNKKVSELTLDECALLAGLPRAPSLYTPLKYPERAIKRRAVVLAAMVREGYITAAAAEEAAKTPLKLVPVNPGASRAPHFVQQVKEILIEWFGENAVYKGGLEVQTTLDMSLQNIAVKILDRSLAEMNKNIELTSTDDPKPLKGALAAYQVGTGAVLAWVGGPGDDRNGKDYLIEAPRRPGSSFKPFVYAAAVESGMTQADLVWDAPISYRLPGRDESWSPVNAGGRFEGEITLRRALEISGNVPAVKLLSRIGVDNYLTMVRKLGLTSPPLTRDLTLALGSSEVPLAELISGYRTLAGRGISIEPYWVQTVKDRSGRVIYRANPKRRVAISPETAYIVTDMLTGVMEKTIGNKNSPLKGPLAGIGGGLEETRDSVFIGYSPNMVAGVWVGLDSETATESPLKEEAKGGGGNGPGSGFSAWPIWAKFIEAAQTDRPPVSFDRPSGVVMAPMDLINGGPTTPESPNFVEAAFRAGTQPGKRE